MSAVEEAVAPGYHRHQPTMVMPVESENDLGLLQQIGVIPAFG